MKLLYEVLKTKQCQGGLPIWFMRQAGRYLPEYRELRSTYTDFLSFCGDPKGAAKATLQPLERFDLDAAIIFSDILVIPAALGQSVQFVPGTGPVLSSIQTNDDVNQLSLTHALEKLSATPEALSLTKPHLGSHQALIGFSGAPWTVLCYMLEGGGSKSFDQTRFMRARDPGLVTAVLGMIVELTTMYLKAQIKAGADVIKLFDSWAGLCPSWLHDSMLIAPVKEIISSLKSDYPDTPILYFPRGTQGKCYDYGIDVGADGVALDQFVAVDDIRRHHQFGRIVCQGGLDPMVMKAGQGLLEQEVERYLTAFQNSPYIFNLGHGMVPDMPIDHVAKTIDLVRSLT